MPAKDGPVDLTKSWLAGVILVPIREKPSHSDDMLGLATRLLEDREDVPQRLSKLASEIGMLETLGCRIPADLAGDENKLTCSRSTVGVSLSGRPTGRLQNIHFPHTQTLAETICFIYEIYLGLCRDACLTPELSQLNSGDTLKMTATNGTQARTADFETAITRDDKMELRLWLRLLTCTNLIEAEVRRRLRDEFGITLARFDILAQLERAPGGLAMGQLSRRLMVSNGNVTGLINRLVSEGLVAREPAVHDKRTQIVRLTEAGKQAFSEMVPVHMDWVHGMVGHLDAQDITELLDLLARLKEGLPRRDTDA